jgi:hypothetical protein
MTTGQKVPLLTMEKRIFELSLIKEGATEKVSQIIMPLDNKNHCFNGYECVFGLLKP